MPTDLKHSRKSPTGRPKSGELLHTLTEYSMKAPLESRFGTIFKTSEHHVIVITVVVILMVEFAEYRDFSNCLRTYSRSEHTRVG